MTRFGPAALEVAVEGGVKKLTYPGNKAGVLGVVAKVDRTVTTSLASLCPHSCLSQGLWRLPKAPAMLLPSPAAGAFEVTARLARASLPRRPAKVSRQKAKGLRIACEECGAAKQEEVEAANG